MGGLTDTGLNAKLDTIDTVVDGIQTDLSNGTDGLGALKALIDTLDGVADGLAANAEWSDSGYVATAASDFNAAEVAVVTIEKDVRYELRDAYIDITGFTATATLTFRVYKSVAAAGATYRLLQTFTKVVGTDPVLVPIPDRVHFGYVKVTVQSDNAGDTAVACGYGYSLVERE